MRPESPSVGQDGPGDVPPNPLERFAAGGWRRGLLRLALGVAVLGFVVRYFARDAVRLILDKEVAATLLVGVPVYLVQRAARIEKWRRMIEHSGLVARPFTFLLRVQFIGMVANLLVPVSEALKIWAVCRDRRQVIPAGESLVLDGMLHSAMIGALGLAGAVALASPGAALLTAAVSVTLLPLAGIAVLQWRGRARRVIRVIDSRVLGWCALETACQVLVYGVAFRAIGVDVGPAHVLALAPLLFLADVVMVTPSGVGLREALFAVVLRTVSGAPADAHVAVALLVTAILLVASATGGVVALLLPARR